MTGASHTGDQRYTIQPDCDQLTRLCPELADALTRDNTGTKGATTTTGSVPFNPDVMHAIVELHTAVPQVTAWAAELVHEPWHKRPVLVCLATLPRLHSRMTDLAMVQDATTLEFEVRHWLRMVKQALGLRTPDTPIGHLCPLCSQAVLVAAGSEGYLQQAKGSLTVAWEHAARIYCPLCGESWGPSQWLLLGQMLQPELRESA